MKNDNSELVEYLDKKFTKIDERFDEIDQKFIGVDEKFVKIDTELKYIKETKADKEDVRNLMSAIDAYASKADTYFQEMLMLSHKVDRHEKWIQQIAEKLGVKLEY